MKTDPLSRLRKICLEFPETTERLSHGEPTFFVREKVFAMFDNHHHGAAHVSVWCKAPLGFQEILIAAKPERFFKPPYVGPKGWVGVVLDDSKVDWSEVSDVIRESYRIAAPGSLRELIEGKAPPRRAPKKRRKRAPSSGKRRV